MIGNGNNSRTSPWRTRNGVNASGDERGLQIPSSHLLAQAQKAQEAILCEKAPKMMEYKLEESTKALSGTGKKGPRTT